ncbi:hypothetical protein D3C81_2262280 [compost metagenome]
MKLIRIKTLLRADAVRITNGNSLSPKATVIQASRLSSANMDGLLSGAGMAGVTAIR